MAPLGNKNKAKAATSRDSRRSRSRNTTPTSISSFAAPPESTFTPYLQTPLNPSAPFSDSAIEDILDRGAPTNSNPPSASTLKSIADTTRSQLLVQLAQRGETCEKLLRELAVLKKERAERERQRERDAGERAEREREAERRRKLKKQGTPKKEGKEKEREKEKEKEDERPLAVGAHGLARQDGMEVHKEESSSSISSPASHPPPSLPDAPPQAEKQEPTSPASSTASPHQPPPAPAVQHYQLFGEDPSSFPDPTIYHIRDLTPDMDEEEIKEILSVAVYPESDLKDLTCGTPPDKDFSNARPANQIAATTFANYVEPYIRPLTEEDRAFLLERGDREKAFIMPKRGTKHYKDIWREEDEGMDIDAPRASSPTNVPRGDMDMMNDTVAESDDVSTGPVLARLLTLMRDQSSHDADGDNGVNGTDMDIDTTNANGTTDSPEHTSKQQEQQPPATQMPDWKNAPTVPRTDYNEMDDRILQELRWMGFLSPTETPDYNSGHDDEIAARLRYLQAELRRQSIVNGARKARLLELTEERMAGQEWQQIADDVDTQLNQAYLKRNRNISKKGSKVKRPGGAGGGSHAVGVARPGANAVGEPIRQLMERREKWRSLIGPVVNLGKFQVPRGSVFEGGDMERLIAKEQERWGEVEDV